MTLASRKEWQKPSLQRALGAENNFLDVFKESLSSDFIVEKPREFKNIYQTVELPDTVLQEIYQPVTPINRHGIAPDFVIRNINTGKSIYVEVKRQDGWVEGGIRADGRGNAHERCLKYFSPGLLNTLYEHSGIKSPSLPFWVVFQGNITRDPCRVREISLWFTGVEDHCFMWRPSHTSKDIVTHFENKLQHLLES